MGDMIEEVLKKKGRSQLRKSEGFVGSTYIELELYYDETWGSEPYIMVASTDRNVVTAESYGIKEKAEGDYQTLKNKYRLKVSTPQK